MNTNPTTSIRHTIYSAIKLDGDVLAGLLDNGKDLTYAAALKEHLEREFSKFQEAADELAIARAETGADRENSDIGEDDPCFDEAEVADKFAQNYEDYEPIINGEVDGIKYRLNWFGGARQLTVSESPVIGHFALCAPGACDGDNPTSREGGFMGYAVPPNWLYADPDPRTFEQCLEEE